MPTGRKWLGFNLRNLLKSIRPLAERPLATAPGVFVGMEWIEDTTGISYVVDRVGGTQVWLQTSGGNAGAVLTRTLFVDAGSTATSPDGSIGRPFPTISGALAVIPIATDLASSRTVWVLMIVTGTYDEDLTIVMGDAGGAKRILLAGLGPWNLGQFDAADWAPSGVRRNITLTGAGTTVGGIRAAFGICSLLPIGERVSTHQSYFTGARISGQILPQIVGGSCEIDIDAEVFGSTGTSAGTSFDATLTSPILQVYLYNGRFRGKFNSGTNGNFQHAERVRFDGLLTIPNYSLLRECRLNAGATVTSAANAGLFPDGFMGCYFAPGTTFTGPAASLRLDGTSNYWFKTGACVLAGGATKVILDDLVP